ncbi:hypothetical protein DE146DRAFT_756966 [Phaeosphaeria sp. MPI-PUGE-AT-0046c]|nr:hypothetical protein DE146DRAFT_756966 [Phaeosphaeria sp. MPI-PUGE-AT-0046c]
MSWNYANGQSGFGAQQPSHYVQQPPYGQFPPVPAYPAAGPPQRPPNIQPPKKKGNPIITRYPPPPGYRGPAQPQGPFHANPYPKQYQGPQPGIPPTYPTPGYAGPPTPQGYSPQTYGPPHPPAYPPQSYPPTPTYSWPQQGYQPNQPYSQPHNHPVTPAYAPPASNHASYQPQTAPLGNGWGWPSSNGQSQPPPGHEYNSYSGPPHQSYQGSDPNATPTPTSAHMVGVQVSQPYSQPTSTKDEKAPGDKPQLFLAWDDWDFDFEGAIWPKSNEALDPALSLGVIIWHPAKQVTRALPSTFDEAEEEALRPSPEGLGNGNSVSVYFMPENSHEAFLDVRQTDEWERIKDDPIFVVFTDEAMQQNLVSLEDCIAQRDRPDEDAAMHSDPDEQMPDASWNVMDHLEQELANNHRLPRFNERSRATSTDPSQEDILARLGVTGPPKPPSDEPMPLPFRENGDAEPLRFRQHSQLLTGQASASAGATANSTPQSGRNSMLSGRGHQQQHPVPPPPPPPLGQRFGSWAQTQQNSPSTLDSRGSPALSEGSNHTMAGSDFEPDNNTAKGEDMIPAPARRTSSFNRKRSYEDADQDHERQPQQDDYSKRKRRSQVDAAYR